MHLSRRAVVPLLVLLIVFGGGASLDASAPHGEADRVTPSEIVGEGAGAAPIRTKRGSDRATELDAAAGPGTGDRATGSQPTRSALVTVAGSSVHDVFAQHVGRAVPAAMVRPLAGKLSGELRAAEQDVERAQAPIVARAASLGIRVISRYAAAANGLLVHGTASQLEALAQMPGVVRIEDAPRVKPALARSVPRVGAADVAARLGYTGTNTIVAIVDTGIDYTHASFGGPGNPDAYAQASQNAETIDDKWQGLRLFPNDIVVGGWDFVGPNYTHPDLCPPEAEAAGACTSTPHPDPDPLDQHGHGTHVASAAGGRATESVSHGVAPGTSFVALKVYGPPQNHGDTDETIDVLVDAVDWCVRVNLGLSVPGVAPPAPGVIHVINMSLGEPYGQGSKLVDAAFEAATDAGMVLVTAAGNDGDRPYIASAPGASPSALSVAATALGATDDGDVMSGFSARGPSKNGALKPDLSAPGPVITARYGTGSGASSSSGTSLSAPHVAGAAALLFERSSAEGLGFTSREIGAMLMNTSRPMPDGAGNVPVVRQGAGRLDVSRATAASVVVRAGDIASLNLGAVSLTEGTTVNRTLSVRNLSTESIRLKLASRFRVAEDDGAGVFVNVPEAPVVVPARGTTEIPVSFTMDVGELRSWAPVGNTPPFESAVVDRLEIDGHVALTPVDADGQVVDDGVDVRVPFYVLPRQASNLQVSLEASEDVLSLHNAGTAAGEAELFVVPDGGRVDDPDEENVVGELDVRQVGVRFDPDGRTLSFGVALHDVAVVPHLTQLELYIDVDQDGLTDYRLRAGGVSYDIGDTMVAIGPWDEATGGLIGEERIVGDGHYDLHSRVFRVDVPLSELGIGADAPFDFYVLHRALTEDWWGLAQVDAVPDGYDGPCGRARLRVEPAAWRGLPSVWRADVEGGARVDVPRSGGGGSRTPALLVLFPDNRFEEPDAMVSVVTRGADPEPAGSGGVCQAFLPIMVRAHRLLPLDPPDAMLDDAFDAIADVTWAKLKWDITDRRDAAADGFRVYRFRAPDGMAYVWTPRVGEVQREYIRVGAEGFMRLVPFGDPQPWQCHPVDEHMLFLPEWVDRLRTAMPETGWSIIGESTYRGRRTTLLRHEDGGDTAFVAQIDAELGLPLFMSSTRTDPYVIRRDVYELLDYGVENVGMSRPGGLRCP